MRCSAWLPWCLLIVVASGLVGCPRRAEAPRPTEGRACMTTADCNPDASCGALSVCVDGLCEAGRSLDVPCR